MVSLYSCCFRHDPGAEFTCTTKSEQNRPFWNQHMFVRTAAQAVLRPGAGGGWSEYFSPFCIHLLSPLKASSKQSSTAFFFFGKWLHTPPPPAGKNMGCWGNASKSYPSPEHFPGPDPKDRRLPQGHHHPPWGTRTSETPNITCLGSRQTFLQGS